MHNWVSRPGRKGLRQGPALLAAILVVAIWGETFVSSKVLLNAGLFPAEIFVCRFLLAYAGIWVVSPKRLWSESWMHELKLMAVGLMGGSLYFLSENMALMYSTASNVAIIVGTVPLVTAILMACFYRDERLNRRQIVGSIIAFAGLVMVILNGQLILHLNPLGDLLAFGAALTWGVYSLVMKQLSPHYGVTFITRKVFAYGLLTILPYFALVDPFNFNAQVFAQPRVWMNLLYLGLVASLLCFILWNWVLKRLGTVKATNLLYLQTLFTMLISSIVLAEQITLMAVSGALILIMGMVMASRN